MTHDGTNSCDADLMAATTDPAHTPRERLEVSSTPVTGGGNGVAPPLTLRQKGGGVVGEAPLGVAYEGPPRYVHGGTSALLMELDPRGPHRPPGRAGDATAFEQD